MSDQNDWARAFAKQAKADFEAWNSLSKRARVASCHRLHFLQMACEKLAKAHLCRGGSDPSKLQASHAYVARNLPIIVREQLIRLTGKRPKRSDFVLKHAKHLAREIELLAPAVDDGGRRPDNCEYPWEDEGGNIHVPFEHSFSALGLVAGPAGRTFLKLVGEAINSLT